MTRPMPGPPEHDLDTREHDGNPAEWCTRCHLINMPDIWAPAPKHLTDAECAAEYWRAEADHTSTRNGEGVGWSSAEVTAALEHEVEVWHRFATHPHAFKETPNE